ncbi:Xaa-Pro peptidase family protein [Lactobacillus mulieris]|uniref:M24 family metallopeptidase n=1 Tax=Lactobacillus mulieris TaxID=2508708 RepID=UPI00143327FD|nr:Xaa-Pro peptidase family protein [Lactobacillus mulieris]MCF1783752.1 Xaa-Pro peptidase family protein [Lactobacillus mulieris]MCW8104346.1 Xaa-Pro peptidase family protein [Lactobacillus mulieris]MDK6803244.1 Xaa-Pro peptidase family protein [Lactobacillus mulieris]MDK8382360.1 Xaa-Pro peptidase family protein [Lactobacillus mulieris]MDT9620589.1 Xaa-Pro peptidase family protein [Lactobacillus mulieris]
MNLDKLQNWLAEHNVDAAYISNPITIAYFTGYEMEPEERIFALLAFKDADPFIFCPALNVEEAKHSEWNGDVYGYLDHENPWQIIKSLVEKRTNSFKHWAIEENNLPVERYNFLRQAFNNSDFDNNLSEFIDHLRLYKTPEEIEKLKAAGAEADFAFQIGFDNIATGVTERYIAGQIDYQLKLQKGVMHQSFETIVQAGENASNPHLGPTMNQIKPNELVLFDLGTMHKGYASDASRTVAYGEPSDKQKEIYEIDREAQQAAIEAAKPGITAAELDAVARDIITKAGYGEYFIHRLGHGIGKNVHEFPSIMQGNDLVIEEGMCFSIEPGIYIPGVGGVRIEDCGVVTKNGFEPFTKTDKALKYIPLRDKK